MLVLFVCDVIGGFIAVASGAETWDGVGLRHPFHGAAADGGAQLVLAWLAARDVRPGVGFVAASSSARSA